MIGHHYRSDSSSFRCFAALGSLVFACVASTKHRAASAYRICPQIESPIIAEGDVGTKNPYS